MVDTNVTVILPLLCCIPRQVGQMLLVVILYANKIISLDSYTPRSAMALKAGLEGSASNAAGSPVSEFE
jgi:hypothetical protein